MTSSIQGNCDTQLQLTTTNSPDVSILKVILNILEGLEGTFVKMVEKICSQHDDNVNEKLENKVKSLSEDKERLLKEKALNCYQSVTLKIPQTNHWVRQMPLEISLAQQRKGVKNSSPSFATQFLKRKC